MICRKLLKVFCCLIFILLSFSSFEANSQDTSCYKLLGVDNSIFSEFYLILFQNSSDDTVFVMSAKDIMNRREYFTNFGEKLAKGGCYIIEFSRKDSLFTEKLSENYTQIDSLEIKFGTKIFWEDHLVQRPVYYSEQIYDLYYKRRSY